MVANGSSAEVSGVRAAPMGTASTMSPSQRRIQRDDHQQQEQEQDAPPPPSSTPNSSNSPYADRLSDGMHLLVALLGALAEAVYDTLAAGLLCLPYSVHLEGWSGGNPTLALIVVHWAATATAAVGKVDRPDAGSDDEDLDLLEEEDEEEEGEGVETVTTATGARIPRGWGVSASDWTSCGRDVFEGSGSSRRKYTTVMLASVPSSPYLRSTSTTIPSSPRFGAVGSNSGSVPSTPTGTGRHGHGHRGSGAVVELDWSGASASGSPRIRPSGWSSGRTMSYGGGGAAGGGGGGSGSTGAPAMGRRRSSGSGSYSGLGFGLGLGLGGAASLPGTPAAGAGGVLSSPFFGAIRTSSLSSSSRPANGAVGTGTGLGLTALTLRENEEEEDDDGPDQERERERDRDRNRARSTSVSSLASVPELSLGAAAVSLSHGVSTPGGGGGSDALFVESSFSSQRGRGRSRLGLSPGRRRPGRLRLLRSQSQSRVRLRLLQEGHRRRQRGRPVRMYRFAVTYAAMLHYLATALALRALLDEIRSRTTSDSRSPDRGGLVKAVCGVLVCGMSMEARSKAEGLGLRRSSLGACVLLLFAVGFVLSDSH